MNCCVIQLDHIRNEIKYLKNLREICSSSSTSATLLKFKQKQIFLIVCGKEEQSIKKFIMTFKTVNVDISSKGTKCKERMANVLCNTLIDPQSSLFREDSTVLVHDIDIAQEVAEWFAKAKATDVFCTHLKPYLKF